MLTLFLKPQNTQTATRGKILKADLIPVAMHSGLFPDFLRINWVQPTAVSTRAASDWMHTTLSLLCPLHTAQSYKTQNK